MARIDGVDIQKPNHMLVFVYLFARNLSGDYLAKNTVGHAGSIHVPSMKVSGTSTAHPPHATLHKKIRAYILPHVHQSLVALPKTIRPVGHSSRLRPQAIQV